MVVDKSTGKGCAWSIASKAITKKLIAENIIDKLIAKPSSLNRYAFLRVEEYAESVYVMGEKSKELAAEPLWLPSFIDAEIWKQAVSKFRRFKRLDRSVEEYLLPEMGEYLENIPNAELVSMTRDFLIEQGVINSPISQRGGDTYYFDENEVYSLDKNSERFLYEKRIRFHLFKIEFETCFDMRVWRKAVSQFETGMTLTECIGIFLETELVCGGQQDLSPVDQLVQYIAPPIYERVPENANDDTCDHIRKIVGLPCYKFSWEALQAEVKKYHREIYELVIQKLEKDRKFKRYGVPINFLKLSDVTERRPGAMELIIELRGTGTDELLDIED